MKIGLLATADDNPYATALTARLIQQNDGPHCIILAAEPTLRRLVAYVRVAGLRATMRRIADRYRPGGLPDLDARFRLREYAADWNGRQDADPTPQGTPPTKPGLLDWDTPLSIQAAKRGIQLLRVASVHDERVVRRVGENGLDLLINTTGVIFKSPLLKAPRLGMLNAHMARLPEFRGMNVLEWSLWFGRPPGITVHFVTPGIDLGDILEFRAIPVSPDDTVSSLRCKSYPVMVETMADCVAALREGRAVRTPQQREQGRQYFVMHPKLLAVVEQRLGRFKASFRV